jgi:hypothetical protein
MPKYVGRRPRAVAKGSIKQIKNSLNPERAYFSSIMCYFLVINAAAVLGRLFFNKAFLTCSKDRACFN